MKAQADFFDKAAGDFDYDADQPREEFIRQMKAAGYRIVAPEPNQLQIDIDTPEQYAVYQHAIECVMRNWPRCAALTFEEHASKSGWPARHITITLPFEVDPWQRIALQAALGSDPIRELLSATRLLKGAELPTLFVEK